MTTICGVEVHPDMRELLDAKAAVPTDTRTAHRTGWNDYAAKMQRPYPAGMVVENKTLSCPGVGKDGMIAIRVYRPAEAPKPSPCVFYIHGGAFRIGSLDSGDPIAWGAADRTGCVVISVDYRLAPEHPFPAALDDCYAAVKYVADRASAFGIDPKRIAIWGDSAGGNLAAATCLMARDCGGPAIAAQQLVYPCLTDELTLPAYKSFAEAPISTKQMDESWGLYLGKNRPTKNGYAAPLKAPDLRNLPPAHIHYAEIDCLADDAREYAKRLSAAGNEVVLAEAKGMIHGFVRSRFSGPVAAAEFDRGCNFLRRVFGMKPAAQTK